ncbi:hypothetical protein [Shinella sp.]|uniref:hypothetical protein n=1 Tax=Shinella sp. TaxID=1870904 RepID=UPI00258ECFF7|nr:hypothetical protein [Shinella sp.]MCO5136270.1 hypothetical protein [Shinella sp.]
MASFQIAVVGDGIVVDVQRKPGRSGSRRRIVMSMVSRSASCHAQEERGKLSSLAFRRRAANLTREGCCNSLSAAQFLETNAWNSGSGCRVKKRLHLVRSPGRHQRVADRATLSPSSSFPRSSGAVFAQGWEPCVNARFAVEILPGFTLVQEADNGDGRTYAKGEALHLANHLATGLFGEEVADRRTISAGWLTATGRRRAEASSFRHARRFHPLPPDRSRCATTPQPLRAGIPAVDEGGDLAVRRGDW